MKALTSHNTLELCKDFIFKGCDDAEMFTSKMHDPRTRITVV